MKRFLYIGILLILLTSCSSPKVLTETKVVTDTITVEKKIIERDTVFVTDSARVSLRVPLQKLTDTSVPFTPIIQQHKNARVIIKRVRDTLRFTAECDSIELAAKIRDQFVKENRSKETVKTEIVRVRYVPWLVKSLAWLGGIALLLVGFKVASKFYGLKLPI